MFPLWLICYTARVYLSELKAGHDAFFRTKSHTSCRLLDCPLSVLGSDPGSHRALCSSEFLTSGHSKDKAEWLDCSFSCRGHIFKGWPYHTKTLFSVTPRRWPLILSDCFLWKVLSHQPVSLWLGLHSHTDTENEKECLVMPLSDICLPHPSLCKLSIKADFVLCGEGVKFTSM